MFKTVGSIFSLIHEKSLFPCNSIILKPRVSYNLKTDCIAGNRDFFFLFKTGLAVRYVMYFEMVVKNGKPGTK